MFSSLHKSIIKDVYSKNIVNSLDFFIKYLNPKPFDEKINNVKYSNAYLISDFQETYYHFSEFISLLEKLIVSGYIRLNFNPKNKELFTVIQDSPLSQKFEESQPIYQLLYNVITKDIVITDKKELKKLIKHKFLTPSEYRERILKIIHIILVIVAIVVSISSLYLQAHFHNKSLSQKHETIIKEPIKISDSLKIIIDTNSLKTLLDNYYISDTLKANK